MLGGVRPRVGCRGQPLLVQPPAREAEGEVEADDDVRVAGAQAEQVVHQHGGVSAVGQRDEFAVQDLGDPDVLRGAVPAARPVDGHGAADHYRACHIRTT